MDKALMEKWVAALRSGKYKQGQRYLNNENKYCCLGVLCEIENFAREIYNITDAESKIVAYRSPESPKISYNTYPGVSLKSRFGFIPSISADLAFLNDTGKTFNGIADIIEKYYEEL